MRAKLIHYSSEWIEGSYSPPESLVGKSHLTVWNIRQNSQSGEIILKLHQGAGIWDKNGKLILYNHDFADLLWINNSTELLCAENIFGSCENEEGVKHVLKRFKVDAYTVPKAELHICVPSGGVHYLIINHKENKCLVTWLEQSSWGFILIDLMAMNQLSNSYQWPSPTLSPPRFSPDDSFVVSCNYYRAGWWTDDLDEYWDCPSIGGLFKVGVISIYNVLSGDISNHDVLVLLPEGWLPSDAANSDWDMIWGPEFISNKEFCIWLPDGSEKVLQLPLPEKIKIDDKYINNTRL